MKKICVITGSRAEYGLLRSTLKEISKSKILSLRLIATASHLSQEYGYTIDQIKKDKIKISKEIETLLSSDTHIGVSKTFGLGVISFSEALQDLKPDILLVTGDRYEMLSATIAALFQRIPIAHIHGGEKTIGSFDDSIRHSITKMSNFHFVANKEYKKRVIQLGENPESVYVVGGLGVDNLNRKKLYNKKTLEKILKTKFNEKNFLITYHPETVGIKSSAKDFKELLKSLNLLKNTNFYFTMPNADNTSKLILKEIKKFIQTNNNSFFYKSLGHTKYFSLMQIIDCVVGNSSSGISEAPSFKIPTINIGNRQDGRARAKSIIDCNAYEKEITNAFKIINSKSFKKNLDHVINPYGNGGASKRIVRTIEKVIKNKIPLKNFYDINYD